MSENEANQRTACYLGLNPYAPETWPVETVNRLSRIHAEQGEEAFRREVDNLMTPPAGIHSPQNACCYRDKCCESAAALAAAEGRIKALSAERETAALHGYQIAVNDLTFFRIKIAEPFDTAFETNKQFCLDMLNKNLRQMRANAATKDQPHEA